jgi:hypothetical protein
MAAAERVGIGWVLWVAGWALLVGCGAFVIPAYFLLGQAIGSVVLAMVVLLSCGLAWLASSAARAWNAEEDARASAASAQRRRLPRPAGVSAKSTGASQQ